MTRAAVGLCALGAIAACSGSTPVVQLGPPKARPRAEDYRDHRDRWTRSGRIIKELDTTLRVHATCVSPEFIAAYVTRRGHLFRLPSSDQQQLERELRAEWDKAYVFYVAAATINFGWNDFDRQRSVWRVALANSRGQEVTADDVRSEEINATVSSLFPFVGRFHRFYTFRFPKTLADGTPLLDGSSERFALRFSGPLGQTELVWRLK